MGCRDFMEARSMNSGRWFWTRLFNVAALRQSSRINHAEPRSAETFICEVLRLREHPAEKDNCFGLQAATWITLQIRNFSNPTLETAEWPKRSRT